MREGVLFRALEGRAPDATSAADARANGVSLALIHNAAETFHAAAPLYRLDIDHLLRRPLTQILESGLVNDARARDDLRSIAGRAEKSIESFDNLTWTHCHGDCHGFNARIIATGEAAFFDFDDGGPGFLAYDLIGLSLGESLFRPQTDRDVERFCRRISRSSSNSPE